MKHEDELKQIKFLNSQPEKKYREIFCWYLAEYVDQRSSYYFTYNELQKLATIPIDDRYFYMKHVLDVRENGSTWFNNSCYIGSHKRYVDICHKHNLDNRVYNNWQNSEDVG